MSSERREVISILFSDIKGYSRIDDDSLLGKLKSFANVFWQKTLNSSNHIYYNSWGDAFLICAHDPVDLSEIALKLRDEFRNTSWRRLGFEDELAIRIGLHVDSFHLVYDRSKIVDIYGKAVNKAARIEPIVDPNKIFCSKFYYGLLNQDPLLKYRYEPLGKRQLAKGWGAMELYELMRENEPIISQKKKISPQSGKGTFRIPRKFTDQDLDDFLD